MSKKQSKRAATKGKPRREPADNVIDIPARLAEWKVFPASGVCLDGLTENERFRHDAVVVLADAVEKAAAAAHQCVLRHTGPDRGRYRSAITLLLACKKSFRERGTAAEAELQKDPLEKIAREARSYVMPSPGASPTTADEFMAWSANTYPDERVEQWSARGLVPAQTVSQERIPRKRPEWAGQLRERVTSLLKGPGNDGHKAAECVVLVEKAIHCAPEISDLRTLLPLDDTTEEREKRATRRAHATKAVKLNLQRDVRDSELAIQAILKAFGYPLRRARGLFDAEAQRVARGRAEVT